MGRWFPGGYPPIVPTWAAFPFVVTVDPGPNAPL